MISQGRYGFEQINVAQQRRNPNTMLNWTERIKRMRKHAGRPAGIIHLDAAGHHQIADLGAGADSTRNPGDERACLALVEQPVSRT